MKQKVFLSNDEPQRFHEPPQTREESPHANRRSRRWSWLAKCVLPVMLLCCLASEVWAENFDRSPFLSSDIKVTWNASSRRFEFNFCITRFDDSPDTFYEVFDMQVSNQLTLFKFNYSDRYSNNGRNMIDYKVSCLNNNNDGLVNIAGYSSTSGVLTFYEEPTGSEKSNVWITVYWYPTNQYADKEISFDFYATKGSKVIHNDVIYKRTATNPVKTPAISSFTYNPNGTSTINVNFPLQDGDGITPIRGADYASYNQTNWANLGSFINSSLTSGKLTETNVTNGWKLRAWHKWDLKDNLRMDYIKYTNDYSVLPIKLPTNPKEEILENGNVKLTWDVDKTTTQHSQAGKVVIHIHTATNASNKIIATVPYTDGQYEYDMKDYINTGAAAGTLFTFDFFREPFTEVYQKWVQIERNMYYRKASIAQINKSGNNGIYLKWTNDNGFYRNNYKYRFVASQGTKKWSPNENINLTEGSVTVNISDAINDGFGTCDPINVKLEMIDPSDPEKVLSTSGVASITISNTTTDSKITSLNVSKGYYTDRVRLNWVVSDANEFVRYLVYRTEYETKDATPILVNTVSHLAGITTYSIEDMQIQPGVFYTYRVEGQKDCGVGTQLNTIFSITDEGYVQPFGVVSGRVTYAAGATAVQGVSISAEGTAELKNKVLDFTPTNDTYISTPYKAGTLDPNHFSFQAWVQLRPYDKAYDPQYQETDPPLVDTDTKRQQFLYANKKYSLTLWNEGQLTLEYMKGVNDVVRVYSKVKIPSGTYHHITVTFGVADGKTETVFYLDGVPKDTVTSTDMPYQSFSANDSINFGRNVVSKVWLLSGYMDEVRLWTKTLTAEEIKGNYDSYLSGKEEGLSIYYRFDETATLGRVFDISGRNGKFNENHGIIHGAVQRTSAEGAVPTSNQLAIKAITDKYGNYLINTIPYTGTGNTYNIIPTLGVHDFNPGQRPLFFSFNSATHNNIDFTDASSFSVSGTVMYDGGNYPVAGCNFEVDDRILTQSNGQPVASVADGTFTISVPIGVHKVRAVKLGHTFVDDGLLLNPDGTNRNYNDSLSDIRFYDKTRVKLVGHVVGGLPEHNKSIGFGETVNNLGVDSIVLKTARQQDDLQLSNTTEIFAHNSGQWKKPDGLTDDSTTVIYGKKDITIHISPQTGEFVAMVYPEVYNIQPIVAPGTYYGEDIMENAQPLDLTSAPVPNDNMLKTSIRTWEDSVWVQRPGMQPGYQKVELSDTVRYHADWKYYYQITPSFSVAQLEKGTPVNYFGETEYEYTDPDNGDKITIPLIAANPTNPVDSASYTFKKPVFRQRNEYTFALEAFEEYRNEKPENSGIYRYPVAGGKVYFYNNLTESNTEPIELDSVGKGTYTFFPGAPDLTTGSNSFDATVEVGNFRYNWNLASPYINAWHLGDKSTGTNFVTAGPDQITAILRDPPGSKSYAFIQEGTTISNKISTKISEGFSENIKLTTSLGPTITTIVGLGAMIETKAETTLNVTAGMKIETKLSAGLNYTSKTVTTERFQTSAEPNYVGNAGDLFIGNSTNILYGITNAISIQKVNDPTINDKGGVNPFIEADVNNRKFTIAPSMSLGLGQNFTTRFAYTEAELEDIMIPKWKMMIKNMLEPVGATPRPDYITTPVWVSKLTANDPDYGKMNMDPDIVKTHGFPADAYDGYSYKIVFPAGYDQSAFVDSVMWMNNQINGWTETLARNEKEKVKLIQKGFEGNYSFGGGGAIDYRKTTSESYVVTAGFHFAISPSVGLTTGGKVSGIGMKLEATIETTTELDINDEFTDETEISTGFHLEESGTNDEITVDYGVTESGTYAFRTRGGQTSCPYEGERYTRYYEPGKHLLSEATMRIEVPKITIAGSSQLLNVPANRTASFVLELKNESETNNDVTFQLVVDDKTNPNGASLSIDQLGIGNGRQFKVEAGKVLEKTLTVGKGSVDQYHNIGIILRSQCEGGVIADTTYFSVEFIPACSEVAIADPANNWVVNTVTGDAMNIRLNGFDRNFDNFGYITLEYRPAGTNTFTTLQTFYADSTLYKNASEGADYKQVIQAASPVLNYQWNMRSVPDGNYEIRAAAVCVNRNANGTIASILSENPTEALTGVKDMSRPESLGAPSPANGILTASDEISITYNENIQTGMLTQNKFSITGILNASILQEPGIGLLFSGANTAFTELPLYANGSFSIETWFTRRVNTQGTLFAYGEGSDIISLGFDIDGHAVVKIGNETKTSKDAIENENNNTWKYVALSYNRITNRVSVYEFESATTRVLFDGEIFTQTPATQGKLHVGAMPDGSSGFRGSAGRLHFYDVAHSLADASSVKNEAKSGTEPNLVGFWELNEGEGNIAKDKARSRNLTLNTGWYIYPEGRALALNGSNYSTVPSGTFPFRYYDDFSIEFQFRGGAQSNVNLLSLGISTHIGTDADQNLVLTSAGNMQILSAASLTDEQWHHLALSVKRNGMVTAMIDGETTASFSSSIFDEVGGGVYTLGACHTLNGTQDVFDRYFTGNIDELRVWNTALSSEAVRRNIHYKLRGNEKGLKAYYPFETWTRATNGTYNVLDCKTNIVTGADELGGTASTGNTAASMIDARPETQLGYPNDYTYTASDNRIVFNILAPLYKIEGVTLTITADGILDMYGNESKPAQWIAFVNRNPLVWVTDKVDIAMQQSEKRTFKASITNNGGILTDYRIEDLPAWLSVDAPQGSLQPLATKELTFTVFEGVNIGSYEAPVALTSANSVKKILPVRLKVTGEHPNWTVNPADFEASMNITGQVKIGNVYQEDPDDLLAAFIGNLCVGVTSPKYISENNAYFTFSTVYGNNEHNDQPLTFKYWEAGTGRIYSKVETSKGIIRFTPSSTRGSISDPVVFTTQNVMEQIIALKKGWTWISSGMTSSSPVIFEQIKASLSEDGTLIKGRDAYVQQPNWVGTLSGISPANMYIVNTSKAHTLMLEGEYANPATTPVTIAPAWNWIGYIPSASMSAGNALAGINAQAGDLIKSQTAFATYAGVNGWIGDLTYMQPGNGYMYYSAAGANRTLIYPSASVLRSENDFPELRSSTDTKRWTADYNRFPNSMTLTCIVLDVNDQTMLSDRVEIGAFSGNECRGSALLQYVDGMPSPYLGFLMVYGDGNEEIRLKVYDHAADREYNATNSAIRFVADAMRGNPTDPYRVTLGVNTGIGDIQALAVSVRPNPASISLQIVRPWETVEVLEITDISGRIIFRKENFAEESLNVSAFNKGVYILRLIHNGQIFTRKFVKN